MQRILHSPVGHARGIASESRWREKEKNSRENVRGASKSGIYVLINVKQIAIVTCATRTTAVSFRTTSAIEMHFGEEYFARAKDLRLLQLRKISSSG